MRFWRMGLVLAMAALLAGCTSGGLGDRVAVKAVYVEKEADYEARILVLEAAPSADTGQASEQARCLAGSGTTVYEALQAAEQSESKRLFYGQNELLFIGPRLMEDGVFDACRYLASDTSGRPNMAVYGLDADPDTFEQLQQEGTEFLNGVEQLEKRGLFKTYLYQFESDSGIIPGLSVQENTAAFDKLTLYGAGRPTAVWRGAKAQLARLLAGQADEMELTLEPLSVSFQVRSPKLRFEPVLTREGMELDVRFSGTIQRLVSPRGAALPGQDRQLEEAIDREVHSLLNELVDDTLRKGNDVFLLGSRLANLDERTCAAMQADGRLSQAGVVQFDCLLRMV